MHAYRPRNLSRTSPGTCKKRKYGAPDKKSNLYISCTTFADFHSLCAICTERGFHYIGNYFVFFLFLFLFKRYDGEKRRSSILGVIYFSSLGPGIATVSTLSLCVILGVIGVRSFFSLFSFFHLLP